MRDSTWRSQVKGLNLICSNLPINAKECSVWYRQQDGGHGSWNPRKECVTTHLPNQTASKTDGAQAVSRSFFYRLPETWPFKWYLEFLFSFLIKLERVGGLPRIGTFLLWARLFWSCSKRMECIEAVLARDRGATYSADLGSSSKESYWEYNRRWPKRRKVPCCSLVRRGWVSPKSLTETVLNRYSFLKVSLIRHGSFWVSFSGA